MLLFVAVPFSVLTCVCLSRNVMLIGAIKLCKSAWLAVYFCLFSAGRGTCHCLMLSCQQSVGILFTADRRNDTVLNLQ